MLPDSSACSCDCSDGIIVHLCVTLTSLTLPHPALVTIHAVLRLHSIAGRYLGAGPLLHCGQLRKYPGENSGAVH